MALIVVPGRVGTVTTQEVNGRNGTEQVMQVSIADTSVHNRDNSNQQQDPWYRFSIWGKGVQGIGQYIKKGGLLMVSGTLSVSTYQKKDGSVGVQKTINRPEITLMGGGKAEDAGNAFVGAAAVSQQPTPSLDTSSLTPDDDDTPF